MIIINLSYVVSKADRLICGNEDFLVGFSSGYFDGTITDWCSETVHLGLEVLILWCGLAAGQDCSKVFYTLRVIGAVFHSTKVRLSTAESKNQIPCSVNLGFSFPLLTGKRCRNFGVRRYYNKSSSSRLRFYTVSTLMFLHVYYHALSRKQTQAHKHCVISSVKGSMYY